MRLVLEQPCEHGRMGCSRYWMGDAVFEDDAWIQRRVDCPGGTRTIIDPDHLPAHAIEAAVNRLVANKLPIGVRDDWLDAKIRREVERDVIVAIGAFLNALGEDHG